MMITATMAARPMSRSEPGAIWNLLSPDPVSSPKMISSSTVVTMFTTWDIATAAAIVLSSTFSRCR